MDSNRIVIINVYGHDDEIIYKAQYSGFLLNIIYASKFLYYKTVFVYLFVCVCLFVCLFVCFMDTQKQ